MDHTPGPEDDDLGDLDFLAADVSADASDLDALQYEGSSHSGEDGPLEPSFAVTNPPGTVTVSAFMDGRVTRIDLGPRVTGMTERHLAEEIVVIARLATQDARAAQYEFMLDGMREQGHDDVATRDFLSRDLDLPSPEEATAARAQIFATRYVGDND